MIHFDSIPEPEGFDQKVRAPGLHWLATHPEGTEFPGYWRKFSDKLAQGFGNLCAYCAMYEPVGVVDHFVSRDEDRTLAYEWSNYRYASHWINSSKSALKSAELLDPLRVEDGWFRLLLPSLQLVVDSSKVPPGLISKAEFVLTRLHLRDDERVLRQRQAWYELYLSGELNLEGLHKMAPLIARAIEQQSQAQPL